MSVYPRKRKGGETVWLYDFVIKGARFLGPTHYPSKRAAEAAERLRRTRIAEGRDDSREELTLDQAAGRYWEDVARHHRSARDIERNIETVLRLVGKHKRLTDIRTSTINDAIQRRRKETVVNPARERGRAKASGAALTRYQAAKPVSHATINREFAGTLRPILNHTAEIYELALPRIAWKKLKLEEAGEITREYTAAEMIAWADQLPGWVEQVFFGIALTYGPRFGEMFFPPAALKRDAADGPELELGRYKGPRGIVRESRKDKSLHRLALSDEHAALLAHLADRASAEGFDTIWFDEAGGRLTEISYWGMHGRLIKAAKRAGVPPGRIIHGMRHHAGTQILRRTRNLVLAQNLLGHRQITTTRRYAHASKADMREGLADVSRHNPAALTPALPKPVAKQDDE